VLTDTEIKALKPKTKPYKRADSGGLYVLVAPITKKLPKGSRLWRLAYRHAGKQLTLAFGSYPDVTLAEARARREEAKTSLRQGIDPGKIIKIEKQAVFASTANVFRAVGADWYRRKMVAEGKSESTLTRIRWLLDILNDGIGDRLLSEIEPTDLLDVLRKVEAQEKFETVKRLRATASSVFRYGIAIGSCKRDPASDLRGALTSAKSMPRAAIIDPPEVGKLLRAIDGYQKPMLRLALQLLALTFVRPGNVCGAEWSEFDFDAGVWSIPAKKMKMREPFRLPLSRQVLTALRELRAFGGHTKFLLPSRKRGQPIYANKLNIALRRLGYNAEQVSAHGFRSTASTILNESGKFSPDVIELSLAHQPGGVRAIYNRSKYWSERVELMQWYADHIDELRARGKVVPMSKKAMRREGSA
jgi:integrase